MTLFVGEGKCFWESEKGGRKGREVVMVSVGDKGVKNIVVK